MRGLERPVAAVKPSGGVGRRPHAASAGPTAGAPGPAGTAAGPRSTQGTWRGGPGRARLTSSM
eukprot:scaffold31189_cov58-Phaeocystis_antarctica.AAC.4